MLNTLKRKVWSNVGRKMAHIAAIAVATLSLMIPGILGGSQALAATTPVAAPPAQVTRCRSINNTQEYSQLEVSMVQVSMGPRFCWTGNNVYWYQAQDPFYTITTAGGVAGWRYERVTAVRDEGCYVYHGHSHGYCKWMMQVTFTQTQSDIRGETWTPWIQVYMYYDGRADCATWSSEGTFFSC